MWCASHRPPLGVRLFLSLFAVSRRFSLQPSCHLAVVPLSSFSLLSLLPLSRRSPLPHPATPPPAPPAGPLFSRHAPKSVTGFQSLLVVASNLCSWDFANKTLLRLVHEVRPSRSPPAAGFRGNRTLSALAGVRPSTRGPPASHPKLVPNRRSTAKTQPIAARNHTPTHTPERCENRRRRDLGQAYVGGLHRRLPRRPRAQLASHEHMRRVEHLFRHSHICSSSECSLASTR